MPATPFRFAVSVSVSIDRFRPLLLIVLLAFVARGGIVWLRQTELTQDRDAYLGLAESVANGRGYSSPGTTQPTAYRPPLYPLLLAVGMGEHIAVWVAVINLLSGATAVAVTFHLGRQLGLSDFHAITAAGLTALDPLLVRYASQPMTESICTLLVTAWLLQLLTWLDQPTILRGGWCGVLFGLCALCRPTVWSTAVLLAVWLCWRYWCTTSDGSTADGPSWKPRLAVCAGVALVVAPWGARNALVFGRPILTTTHGGYTLLLGNNPSFYNEVARQPWGTVWDGTHGLGQQGWVSGVLNDLQADSVHGELEQDRWMSDRGWANIRGDVNGFLRATLLRFARFWHILPSGGARDGWPVWVPAAVALFYIMEWSAVLIGLVDAMRRRLCLGMPLLLLIVSFTSVHLVYWSNVRMRAPLVPVLSVLAIHGIQSLFRKRPPSQSAADGLAKDKMSDSG